MYIRSDTFFRRLCAVHLSWLGSHHSSARYLATLTQGKFGRLKINLLFAEKDVKLKKERENKADSSVMIQESTGGEQSTAL